MSGNAEPIAKKSLGQHWLNDLPTLEYICEEAKINATDTVLEIGPGTGNLTKLLVNYASQVVAVEFDQNLADQLPNRVKASNLQVVNQDILKFDLTKLQPNYKVVANIPYYLTSNLIRTLSESTNPPISAVLLVQKEVAQRISAPPGKMSLLSVSAQFYWHVGLGDIVPARLFSPPPKVDSQVITLDMRLDPLFPDVEERQFFRLVKAGFASRRKTLLNSLAGGLRTEKEAVQKALDACHISSGLRAQALSLENWYTVYKTFTELELL